MFCVAQTIRVTNLCVHVVTERRWQVLNQKQCIKDDDAVYLIAGEQQKVKLISHVTGMTR